MPLDATIRAEVQAFSTKQGVEAAFVDAKRQEGVFDGQRVTVVDEQSSLANAAEEMSFAAAEKVEKKLAERKAGSKEALRASAAELAERYVNQTGESQSARKLHEFLDALKNLGANLTEAQLRQFVGEKFGDPTEQFAALSFAEEALAKEGGHEELRAKIANVKAQLLSEAGPAIRSGLNIAADVLAYSRQGLAGAQNLRDLYRFSILGGQSITSIYTAIMSRYGEAQFAQSLEFLLRASGSDLEGKALGSSLEPTQLKSAIDDIFHVQALGNTYRSLNELLNKTGLLFGLWPAGAARPGSYSAHDLMKEILQMTAQRWTDPESFLRLATAAGINPLVARIYFLTQLRERVRLLPLKLFFASPETREKLLEALQTSLDQEISREENG